MEVVSSEWLLGREMTTDGEREGEERVVIEDGLVGIMEDEEWFMLHALRRKT